ncbi:MAG TPA: hypothetical protein PK413_14725, partial [Thermoanaerobaculia bacterium]|nr:hypothetical protein [Thermoanaerobaculia bacterium]
MPTLREILQDYTDGLRSEEFRRLFDRDAANAYEALTRDQESPEPRDQVTRLLHRARRLFFGISAKLTPARRALFGIALFCLVWGLVEPVLSTRWGGKEGFAITIDASPLPYLAGFFCVAFLLTLELVDKLRVRDELEVARQLQKDLLPHHDLALPGYQFAHSYRTAEVVGGDYYDVYPLPDGRFALVVGDASGHGMAAGLVMAIA